MPLVAAPALCRRRQLTERVKGSNVTELEDLVYEWAFTHCPALLDDGPLFRELCCFLARVIDYTILAARRQAIRELNHRQSN